MCFEALNKTIIIFFLKKGPRECWEQAWECMERKKIRADSEAVVDKLRQDENGSLEPSVNLQQLRRQTSAVVNVDMLGTGKGEAVDLDNTKGMIASSQK